MPTPSLQGALSDLAAAITDLDGIDPDEDRADALNDCLASARSLGDTVSVLLDTLGIENDWSA